MTRLGIRGAMLLAVVALGVLLVTPDLCQAHVRARYKADYKQRLADLNTFFGAQALHFDNLKQGAIDTVDTMRPMVGDPDKREQLLAQEEWAHDVWLLIASLPDQYEKTWDKMANRFRGRAALYFAKRSEKEEFLYVTIWFKMAGDLLAKQAMEHIVTAYFWLGGEPLDLDAVSNSAIAGADEDAAAAHDAYDQEYGKLRAMR